MAGLARIDSKTRVLDVGCGIGEPAFHLAEQTGCNISEFLSAAAALKSRRKHVDGRASPKELLFISAMRWITTSQKNLLISPG
jgi:cyclopropane fatty-acyl-phospholipid synthase-like methyltransferase